MIKIWQIVVIHQLIFQGMFVLKNIILHKKSGKQIRGNNIEANISIAFFILFIGTSVWISFLDKPFGEIYLLNRFSAMTLGFIFLFLNFVMSTASLINLKDSWRVGVVENQKTTLITSGVYRYTRNPYFVSYLLMFIAYTVFLQNLILLGQSIIGFVFVHWMIKKEEKYLYSVHGDAYRQYINKVPRYWWI